MCAYSDFLTATNTLLFPNMTFSNQEEWYIRPIEENEENDTQQRTIIFVLSLS